MRPALALMAGGGTRRFIAFLVDHLILGALWLLVAGWAGVVYVSVSRWPGDLLNIAALAGLLGVLWVILHAIYSVVFIGGCGQTPGKMLLGVVVLARNGGAVGYGRAAWRWLATAVAALPLGLGFLGVMLARDKRGLHDLLAGTRVVRAASLPVVGEEVAGLTPLYEPTP